MATAETNSVDRPVPYGAQSSVRSVVEVPIQGAGVIGVDLGAWLAILPHTDRLAWLLSQLRRPGRHR